MTSRPIREAIIPSGSRRLAGELRVPDGARGTVVLAQGEVNGRVSPGDRFVADCLARAGFRTLLFDALTAEEALVDALTMELRFDLDATAGRLCDVTEWLARQPEADGGGIGFFASGLGACAAMRVAARLGPRIAAVVSHDGRPDLAGDALRDVVSPTLLVVGGEDEAAVLLNRSAAARLRCPHDLVVVPGTCRRFDGRGTLDAAASLAVDWFVRHLGPRRD